MILKQSETLMYALFIPFYVANNRDGPWLSL